MASKSLVKWNQNISVAQIKSVVFYVDLVRPATDTAQCEASEWADIRLRKNKGCGVDN